MQPIEPVDRVEVEFVREASHGAMGGPCFEVATLVTLAAGQTRRMLTVYPVWAVAARMAEYGVEQPEAVRMLLAERHMPGTDEVPPVLADPLWRRGAEAGRAEHERVHDALGFAPLDDRLPGESADPLAPMLARAWSADEVNAARLVVADLRQELREPSAPVAAMPIPAGVPLSTG